MLFQLKGFHTEYVCVGECVCGSVHASVCTCLLGPQITLSAAADKRREKEEEEEEERAEWLQELWCP